MLFNDELKIPFRFKKPEFIDVGANSRTKMEKSYLESANVEIITKLIPQELNGISGWISRSERDAQRNKSLDSFRAEQSECPGDSSPPIVADQENTIDGEIVEKAEEVADDVEDGVGGKEDGGIGVAIATKVGSKDTVAKVGEELELVAPRVPELGEAVEEENGGAGSCSADGSDVHIYAIGEDGSVLDVVH